MTSKNTNRVNGEKYPDNAFLQLAPNVRAEDRVVLFDSVCKLCGAWARFLIRFDRRSEFKLSSVQASVASYGMPNDYFETMLLVEGPAGC